MVGGSDLARSALFHFQQSQPKPVGTRGTGKCTSSPGKYVGRKYSSPSLKPETQRDKTNIYITAILEEKKLKLI